MPGMQLIVAEKPQVARDLARVLGVRAQGKHAFEGGARVITWCIGHLVELEEPAAYRAEWRAWRWDALPMVPERFQLRPVVTTAEHFRRVRELLRERRFDEVVNACDAGREGELIFRYLYELAGCRLPVRRLWISSLTDEAIVTGFARLRPGASFDALADAARCRSEADWLVGMNATRAVTLRGRGASSNGERSPLYSIGRVQTPTLALLVEREHAIQDFVPRDYHEVRGRFVTEGAERFEAIWTAAATGATPATTRLATAELAQALCRRDGEHGAADDPLGPVVERVRQKSVREPPPLLFDLTSLQRTANRRYGMSASRTLAVAQSLYERHKLLTYPRTDSRHLTHDLAGTLPRLFSGLATVDDYAPFATELLAHPPPLPRRVFDDKKVSDHHAIIPTDVVGAARVTALSPEERRVFDLVARRFLGAFFPDAEFAATEVTVRVGPPRTIPGDGGSPGEINPGKKNTDQVNETKPILERLPEWPDRYQTRGKVRLVAGWQAVAGIDGEERRAAQDEDSDVEPAQRLPSLVEGQRLSGTFEAVRKQTRPPPRFSEATLLAAMESAGRAVEDEALRQAMKDRGLGTPATRAAIIETLVQRSYVERERKLLLPTEMGIALVDALPVRSLASAELTGEWEARLARVARGEEHAGAFMAEIVRYVHEVVAAVRGSGELATLPMVTVATRGVENRRAGAARKDRAAMATKGAKGSIRSRRSRSAKAMPDTTRHTVRAQGAPKSRALHSSSRQPTEGRASIDQVEATDEQRAETVDVSDLRCPRCQVGHLMEGKRGWGCGRWREGCSFVVWFETMGRRLSAAQLRDLMTRGRTRKASFRPDGGFPLTGHLVLDAAREGGVRFERA